MIPGTLEKQNLHPVLANNFGLPRLLFVSFIILLVLFQIPTVSLAQDDEGDQDAAASASTTPNDTTAAAATDTVEVEKPFFGKLKNTPQIGSRSNVRQVSYYAEFVTEQKMRSSANATNTAKWSWDDYRGRTKTVERRSDKFKYLSGKALPFSLNITASNDWSDDKEVFSNGNGNVAKHDRKSASLTISQKTIRTGFLNNSYNISADMQDQKAISKNQVNNIAESSFSGGLQTGMELVSGVTVAGRLYGSKSSGERSLSYATGSSSATSDSVGVGVYFDKKYSKGKFVISRNNIEERFLDFERNSLGSAGNTGDEKIVSELKTLDAVSLDFDNKLTIGRVGLAASLSHDVQDQTFAESKEGLREQQNDRMKLSTNYATARDSISLTYDYTWMWKDQKPKDATTYIGRQYTKNRDVNLYYNRILFKDTSLSFTYHTGLSQLIAQNEFNANDSDRLASDYSLRAERKWGTTFSSTLVYEYRRSESASIRETKSSNNNTKESYEVAPGYYWQVSDRVRLAQNYRLSIQYTDYVYSEWEDVSVTDKYSKSGNLTTRVTLKPTKRLSVIVKHDMNHRFNANKVSTDVTGNSYYSKNQVQLISKIDFALTFKLTSGVTFEASTLNKKDSKDRIGNTTTTDIDYGGQITTGCRISRKYGKTKSLALSALIKKVNAYGPGIKEDSADYWETDVSLKWSF